MKASEDSLLSRLKQKYRRPLTLTGRYYRVARRMLLDTAEILNTAGVSYFLDAGALLGLVRDGDLIPWDHDLDVYILATELPKLRSTYFKLRMRGWRVSEDSIMAFDGPGWRVGDLRSIKIRNRNMFFFGRGRIIMDVILLYKYEGYYWQGSMGKIWRTPGHFFDRHDSVEFSGKSIHTPANKEEYLTFLYGNWKEPDRGFNPIDSLGGQYCDLDKWENTSGE